MTSVRTMISDLYRNRAKVGSGVCYVGTGVPLQTTTLSNFHRVAQRATPITFAPGAAPDHLFTMARADLAAANAFYLFFEDGWSTVATLNRAHRVVVGGGYSGCLYSVYNAGGGDFKCVHTARPSGPHADSCVDGIRLYARDQGWTLVHEVPTVGAAGVGGCVTTFLATRVSYSVMPNPKVRTVRLRQNMLGRSVAQDRWQDFA